MKKHSILVTTFWSYKDALIQTYTLPYLKIIYRYLPPGSSIYLLTLEHERFSINPEERKEIDAYLANWNIRLCSFPYYPYGIKSLLNWLRIVLSLLWVVFSRRVRVIHSFCTTAGMSAYFISKLSSRPLLIDSYEPHAEASVETGEWRRNSFRFRLLFWLEHLESRHARLVISATEGMRDYARQKYGVTFSRFYVKPACVDLKLFSQANRKNSRLLTQMNYQDKIVAVYAGKFGGIYLDKEVFDFLAEAWHYWGDRFRVLLLTNHNEAQLQRWAEESGLPWELVSVRFVAHADIADYMGLGDFALTPVKPIPTKRYCTPIKNGEYWALGLPVVSTANISDDSEIIEREGIGAIIHTLEQGAYIKAIQQIDHLLTHYSPEELYTRIRAVAIQYRSFEVAERVYESVYGGN